MEAQGYEVIIGEQVHAARSRIGMSEEDLADRMRHLGYASWSHQTVSDAERGDHHLAAAEVLGISLALEVSVADLVLPTRGDQWVVKLHDGPVVPLGGFVPITWEGNSLGFIPPPREKTRHE